MERSATGPGIPSDPPAPGRRVWDRAATRIAQAAVMAAVVTVGVAALSVFPHPHQASPPRVAAAHPHIAPVPRAMPVVPVATPAPAVAAPPLRPRIAPAPAPHHLAVAAVRPRAARAPEPCRAAMVEADRLVCSQPELASLDRRMRAAYARAIAAGADRLEIDRAQARWHGARDRATEPGQLARLYQRRIADLEAAAARTPGRRGPSGGQA